MSDAQIKARLGIENGIVYSEGKLRETIRQSKRAFYESEAKETLSYTEFLYQQSGYIRKRWWVMQGGILLLLWLGLEVTESGFYVQRLMGAAAPLFAVLLLPELWKNRNTGALELEGTAYYSLRQIYAARILLLAMVDLLLLSVFSAAAVLTEKVLIEEMIVQFFLPYLVTCCICFHTLYSYKAVSETFALFLCMVWCAVWTELVLNEIYEKISFPIWLALTAAAVLYLGYCIQKGQRGCRELWEVKSS